MQPVSIGPVELHGDDFINSEAGEDALEFSSEIYELISMPTGNINRQQKSIHTILNELH